MTKPYLTFPEFDPVIVSFGQWPWLGELALRWYSLMYLLGFLLATVMARRAVKRGNIDLTLAQLSDLLFYGFVGAVIGGRCGYVVFYQWSYFVKVPSYLFQVNDGGMSFHGGLLGVAIAVSYFAYRQRRPWLVIADFATPLMPLALGLGRLGNFINGELWGRVTEMPWGIVFPHAGELPRHPSQLYELVLEGPVLFVIIVWYRRQSPPSGAIVALFLLLYGFFRFIVEFFRAPDPHMNLYWQTFTMGQLLTLPMILTGIVLWRVVNNRKPMN